MGIITYPSLSSASRGIFFPYSSAVKLGADTEFMNKGIGNQALQIKEYKKITFGLESSNRLKDLKITGLTLDYKIQEERATKLEQSFSKCNQDLIKEKDNKPSRYTWFSAGFITALAVGLVSIFAIK